MANTVDDLRVTGTLTVKETGISVQTRATILKQETARFPIPWTFLRVWDAYTTNLPGTAATDDLALIGGTFATAPPMIQAGSAAIASITRYARFQLVVPECYVAGQPFAVVFSAGMKTAVADASCTLDLECYKSDKISGISADLCATAATSINSLTFADKSFTITPSTLNPGDILDCRITIAAVDAATGSAVTPTIAGMDISCAICG